MTNTPKTPDGQKGDLIVIIVVKDHHLFKRQGYNIAYEFPIGFGELFTGCDLEIPTLTGLATVKVPPNSNDYTQLCLKGMGLPYMHGGKGDLFVILKLLMPSKDSIDSNKELFDKLFNIEKEYLTKEREKFKFT